jgi:hypothetical protein
MLPAHLVTAIPNTVNSDTVADVAPRTLRIASVLASFMVALPGMLANCRTWHRPKSRHVSCDEFASSAQNLFTVHAAALVLFNAASDSQAGLHTMHVEQMEHRRSVGVAQC